MSNPQPRANLSPAPQSGEGPPPPFTVQCLRSRHPGAHPAAPSPFRRRHAEAGRGGMLPSGSAARHCPRKRPRQLAEAGSGRRGSRGGRSRGALLEGRAAGLENLHDPLAELLQARLRRAGQTDVEVRVHRSGDVGGVPGQPAYRLLVVQLPRAVVCRCRDFRSAPDNSTGDGSGLRHNTDGDSNRDATLRHSGRGSSQTLCRGALRRHRGSVGAGDVSGHA